MRTGARATDRQLMRSFARRGVIWGLALAIAATPLIAGSALAAGATWRFQYWYRDAGGTSNFTDVVSVTFL